MDDAAEHSDERPAKRQARSAETALIALPDAPAAAPRSSLPSPTLVLEKGHTALILGLAFSPDGRTLATCSKDKTVGSCAASWPLSSPKPQPPHFPHPTSHNNNRFAGLWDYFSGCTNTLSLRGHKNAVLRVAWLPGAAQQLATASADRTCAIWDAPSGSRVRTLTGHGRIVNDIAAAPQDACGALLASASDDGSAILWDARTRHAAARVPGRHPLLACALGPHSHALYTAGVEGVVRAYDLRRLGAAGAAQEEDMLPTLTLEGAGGGSGVASLSVSPNGFSLLALAFDGCARVYDVQAFCAAPSRCTRVLAEGSSSSSAGRVGAGAGLGQFDSGLLRACWSPDGERVGSGGADKLGRVWDYATSELLAVLPGHTGPVVELAWHPSEPVLATAGDRVVYIGELSR